LFLSHTWLVSSPINQLNPIERNIIIIKIQHFDIKQIKYSNMRSNNFIIFPLNLQVLLLSFLPCLSCPFSASNTSHFIVNEVKEIRQVAVVSKKERKNFQLVFKHLKCSFKALNCDNFSESTAIIFNDYFAEDFANLLIANI